MQHDKPVYLAYAKTLPHDELFRLKSHYFPLGKVGGFPSWLNPVEVPRVNSLACTRCQKPTAFLLQLYCTAPTDPEHAFHRVIHLFVCRNPSCSKANDASNFRALRCQLPRNNGFYSADKALSADKDGDVPDPLFDAEKYAKLCSICGCSSTQKCGKCQVVWYCSKDHQALDWASHKLKCGKEAAGSKEESNEEVRRKEEEKLANGQWATEAIAPNAFLFPEYDVEMSTEYQHAQPDDDAADSSECESSDDDEEDPAEALKRTMEELKDYEGIAEIPTKDLADLEENAKDSSFKRFHNTIRYDPRQILRYDRGGKPLLATDFAPAPNVVPPCELCGAARQFEFQLTPHLLSQIGVDCVGESIDWATVMVYTCSRSCAIERSGYAQEFVFKQDFVESPDNLPGDNPSDE